MSKVAAVVVEELLLGIWIKRPVAIFSDVEEAEAICAYLNDEDKSTTYEVIEYE